MTLRCVILSRLPRKKHAVYWVLGNISAHSRSTSAFIYLAILCKAETIMQLGLQSVLEPLLTDLKRFVPALGKVIRGTVVSVVADNLGTHSDLSNALWVFTSLAMV